jgi:molybdopterin converting factor small subunit
VVRVAVTSSLQDALGGAASLDVEAASIRQLFQRLLARFPDLQAQLDAGIAVSIDGQIYRDDWSRTIPPGAEVFLLPRIQGG